MPAMLFGAWALYELAMTPSRQGRSCGDDQENCPGCDVHPRLLPHCDRRSLEAGTCVEDSGGLYGFALSAGCGRRDQLAIPCGHPHFGGPPSNPLRAVVSAYRLSELLQTLSEPVRDRRTAASYSTGDG